MLRVGEQRPRRAELDEARHLGAAGARVGQEDSCLVAHAGCLLGVLGCEEDGDAQAVKAFLEFLGGDGVECGRGVVEEQEVGAHGQGAAQAEALDLAGAQAHGGLAKLVLYFEPELGSLEAFLDEGVQVLTVAVQAGGPGYVFVD